MGEYLLSYSTDSIEGPVGAEESKHKDEEIGTSGKYLQRFTSAVPTGCSRRRGRKSGPTLKEDESKKEGNTDVGCFDYHEQRNLGLMIPVVTLDNPSGQECTNRVTHHIGNDGNVCGEISLKIRGSCYRIWLEPLGGEFRSGIQKDRIGTCYDYLSYEGDWMRIIESDSHPRANRGNKQSAHDCHF